jgi:hypothetical protein
MESSVISADQRREPVPASKAKVWSGRILTGLAVAFLLFDGTMKLGPAAPVVEAMSQLGYPAGLARGIGMLLLGCVALHVNPRTSILGAVLLTGYLGGAVASQLRIESPLFSHTLFPVYVGAMIWGGLLLRDERLRALLSPAKSTMGGRSSS